MTQFDDQNLARRLLETRERGYSTSLFFRRNAKRYVSLGSASIAIGIAMAASRHLVPLSFVLGMIATSVLRDINWLSRLRKTSSFMNKVTDWDKVQKLAEGKPLT